MNWADVVYLLAIWCLFAIVAAALYALVRRWAAGDRTPTRPPRRPRSLERPPQTPVRQAPTTQPPAVGLERSPAAPPTDPWAKYAGLDPLEQWRLDGHR